MLTAVFAVRVPVVLGVNLFRRRKYSLSCRRRIPQRNQAVAQARPFPSRRKVNEGLTGSDEEQYSRDHQSEVHCTKQRQIIVSTRHVARADYTHGYNERELEQDVERWCRRAVLDLGCPSEARLTAGQDLLNRAEDTGEVDRQQHESECIYLRQLPPVIAR